MVTQRVHEEVDKKGVEEVTEGTEFNELALLRLIREKEIEE